MTRARIRAGRWAALAATTTVLACEGPPVTAPLAREPTYAISDAVHGDGTAHFFFLPPIVPTAEFTGAFDATMEPVVEICEWTGSACGTVIASYSMTSGVGSETVNVSTTDEHYYVRWHTGDFTLSSAATYRIRVLVGGVLLGFADIDLVDTGSGKQAIDANQFVALINGRTLPIKFRIEAGAVLPVSVDDAYSTDMGVPLVVTSPGVLVNDADPDGDPLTAVTVDPPTHGILVFDEDGSFSYVPSPGFTGTDSFDYVATDGTFDSNVATVTITVNAVGSPPVAVIDAYSTDRDVPLVVAAPGVLANDTDPDGDPLTALTTSVPTHGVLIFGGDGSFSYVPSLGFTGTDSFQYVASDGTFSSNVATVIITVNAVRSPPVAAGDAYNAVMNMPLVVAAPGVLANDTDADGDPLTAVTVGAPTQGVLFLNGDGSFLYFPNPGFTGTDSFRYVANDGTSDSNVATVTIAVNGLGPPLGG